MKQFTLRLLALLTGATMLSCTGCGTEETADSTQASAHSTVAETEPASTETEHIAVQKGSENDDIQITIRDYGKNFNRYNDYTGEVEYSFRVDEMQVKWEKSSEYIEDEYNFSLYFTGEKTYDVLGEDTERPVMLLARLCDADDTVIYSEELYSPEKLAVGDTYTNALFQHDFDEDYDPNGSNNSTKSFLSHLTLEPGTYTLEIISEDDDSQEKAATDASEIDPERHYCTLGVTHNETDAELPYDLETADWVDSFLTADARIEDSTLKGFFGTDFDLSQADAQSEEDNSTFELSPDVLYGKTYRYDIDNPASYLPDVPEEAMPTSIRISYSPHGNIADGARETITIAFCYKHTPEDEYAYVALTFQYNPGNALTVADWSLIQEEAEEFGVTFS